jgi:hypothetical protein
MPLRLRVYSYGSSGCRKGRVFKKRGVNGFQTTA